MVEHIDDLSPDALDQYEQYVEEEKPYWISLRHPRGEPMQFELYDTPFPRYHAELAQEESGEVRADGGQLHTGEKDSVIFYWVDADTDAALTHTELSKNGDDYSIPFFDSVDAAEEYLEQLDDQHDDTLDHLSLYRASVRKEEDATAVLTEQVGLDDML